jgi:hypothetical protein
MKDLEENLSRFPVTLEQFEALVNEALEEVNPLVLPNAVNPGQMSEVVIDVLHHYDRKEGIFVKEDFFLRCLRGLSSRLTFNIGRAIMDKKAQEEASKKMADGENPLKAVPDPDLAD